MSARGKTLKGKSDIVLDLEHPSSPKWRYVYRGGCVQGPFRGMQIIISNGEKARKVEKKSKMLVMKR